MTDREMLELAAKAAGAKMTDYSDRTPDHWIIERVPRGWVAWDPLIDDGDALRLAVKLRIDLEFIADPNPEDAETLSYSRGECHCEFHGHDPYAATRRAIVRAAAEIGRQDRDKQ